MKTISMSQIEQVSGGYTQCLMSIYDAVSNTSHCLVQVSGDMPTFNIPMEYAIPLAIIGFGIQMAYDIHKENRYCQLEPKITLPQITLP